MPNSTIDENGAMLFIADLHTHSTFSDGLLTPTELVARADRNGATLLALTDHDTVSGVPEARLAAQTAGLRLISGVEISVSWENETVHVVGLNVDPEDSRLLSGLADIRAGRDGRAVRMGEALAEAGFPGMLEAAMRFAGNPTLVSRSHFARALVAQGAAPDVHSVFRHYLVPGKPGYVAHQWAELEQALDWIHGAGGVAVIAHPGRYWRLSSTALARLFEQFARLGGRGVEVVSSSHDPSSEARFARVARQYGFLASTASDFHGPSESLVDVGRVSPLPPDLTPVWSLF